MNPLEKLDKKSQFFWMTSGCLFVAGVGVADMMSGSEVALALFYLIPIFIVTWYAGRIWGIAITVIAAITWFIADVLTGHTYSDPAIGYWNAFVRLALFGMVPLLLPALRALEREKEISRIDALTGTANRRYFFEAAQIELYRSQRYKHPFTIVFIDLDGLKAVNDKHGHHAGDELLRAVVDRAKQELRKTDLVARLGGDEFIFLLPEIDQAAAQLTVPKIEAALLDEVQQHGWPVTFSMGALTYQDGAITADELIKRADELMYSVKKNGKNGIAYAIYAGGPTPAPDSTALPA